jgi:predicted nucleic acid-binding protein
LKGKSRVPLRVYLDNCCFNRPFDDQLQLKIKLETDAKLFIQQKILDGTYELVWSYILDFENNQNPYEERRNSIQSWRNIASFCCIETDDILSYAENLSYAGIKVKDALHIACAVYSHCDYFITTDKKLLNTFVKEVKIESPLTFINYLEE